MLMTVAKAIHTYLWTAGPHPPRTFALEQVLDSVIVATVSSLVLTLPWLRRPIE
jgi:hypothetical protein